LICANERGWKFPGLGPTDSCSARKRRGRSWQEFSFRRTERGAVAQNHRCAPSRACSGQELLAFCCAAARTSLPHSSLRNDDTSFTDRPARVVRRLYAFTPCSGRQLPLASPQAAKMALFQTAINTAPGPRRTGSSAGRHRPGPPRPPGRGAGRRRR
jgi:hypothetical protein